MAGIAGFFGAGAQDIDRDAVRRSLIFTGQEKVQYHCSADFFGVSVAHESEASRSPRTVEANDFCILLNGEIVDIDLGTKSVVEPSLIPAECARLLREEGADFARRLNGSFNIAAFDRAGKTLHLINDRFGSRPFFYVTGKGFLAFSSRVETFKCFGIDYAKDIDIGGLAELLVFGRILVNNLWSDVKMVPSANVITYQDGRVKKVRYFNLGFSYGEGPGSIDDNAHEMAHAFKRSVEKRLSGWDNAGVLLSGGLDSRAVLACMPDWATCYTACDRINNETRVAAKVAATQGNRHVLLKRNANHYLEIVPSAARICEGAFDYTHAHMEGLMDRIEESTDGVLFSGYNVDTYLKGACLPHVSIKFRNRNIKLDWPKREIADADLENEIQNTLQSFAGGMTALDILNPDVKKEVWDHPHRAIRRFIEDNRDSVVSNFDYFELTCLKDNCRHYGFPMVLSLRHHLAERCVCFENDLLDVVLRTPPEQRFDGLLWKKAIAVLDERYAKLRNANTLLPPRTPGILSVGSSIIARTYHTAKLAAIRRVAPEASAWTYSIDSWHDQAEFWRSGPVAGRLEQLLSDPLAMRDNLVDPASVRNMIERHRAGKGRYHRIFPVVLTFLEWRRETATD